MVEGEFHGWRPPGEWQRLTVADQALVNIVMWMLLARHRTVEDQASFRQELVELLPEVNRGNPGMHRMIQIAEKLTDARVRIGYDDDLAASDFLRWRAVLALHAARDAAGRDPTIPKEN